MMVFVIRSQSCEKRGEHICQLGIPETIYIWDFQANFVSTSNMK